MTPSQRSAASAQAQALLRARVEWRSARSVLLYAPLPQELDLWPMAAEALAGGKQVFLPRFSPATGTYSPCRVADLALDLKPGHFGIREPAEHCALFLLNGLDLILVPGIAFDLHGRRLGRGKGYYDQMLAGLRGVTCGVAFDEQIVGNVPVAPHDVLVNRILTPTRWVGL